MSEQTEHIALHQKILIIAVHRVEGTWAAYATPVPGINHQNEAPIAWPRYGEKVSERHARHFFPHLKEKPYAT